MVELLSNPQNWISLLTLTALEIVLGVDNVVFISILAGKLPPAQQPKARQLGLSLALITRIALLFSIFLITKLTATLIAVPGVGKAGEISGKDLVLLFGGLFLIWKSVHEIHGSLEGENHEKSSKVVPSFTAVVLQILLVDIVFSLDSVITAVGMAQEIAVMIAAVVLAMGVMLVAAGKISNFVNSHPTVKMLALSFLLMIGVMLVADSFDQHIPKGYIYFSMAFSLLVEVLNLRASRKKKVEPVALREKY